MSHDGQTATADPTDAVTRGIASSPHPVDSQIVADAEGVRPTMPGHPAFPAKEKPKRHWGRWIALVVGAAAVIFAAVFWGWPTLKESLDTVSTDDAFVAGHLTNVGPRVEGLVTEVLVDQNDRVAAGEVLLRLDRQPYEVAAAESRASLEQAKAELVQARSQVRSQIAQARGSYYRRKAAQERLRQQVAALKAAVATLKARESNRSLAEVDQRRIANLVRRGSATQSELDTRNDTLNTAEEQVKAASQQVQEVRAGLGLAANEENPLDLPPDLEQQQSSVQSAVSDIASSLAQVGIPFDPKDADQAKAFSDFLRPEGGKSAGEGLEKVIEQAPTVRVALASEEKAARQLDDANLRLSYTEIRSEIAGYVQDRSVHPGDRIQPGQAVLTVRPTYVWVAANYKETQIRHIRIGQPVDLHVDAYPKRVFKGRVAGFSPGTGLSESLLPPENATGNYVKVTQRLPVRIELTEPNPDDTPLFVGLSVVPYVRFKERATGPGAGQKLHAHGRRGRPDVGGGPAGSRPENRDAGPGAGAP